MQVGEKTKPTIGERIFAVYRGINNSTYGPTETHKMTMDILKNQMTEMEKRLITIDSQMKELSKKLMEAGAPYIEKR